MNDLIVLSTVAPYASTYVLYAKTYVGNSCYTATPISCITASTARQS